MLLEDVSIHAWIANNRIKNEKGDPIEFRDHLFLFDIYSDRSKNIVVMKPAQVGLTTLEMIRNFYDAKKRRLEIVYTMPTDSDVNVLVGGKVNRIIAQNPCMSDWTRDKDSVEQKQVGESMIYFRGTWSKRASISVTADRLVHDEIDASKPEVIADYQSRILHSDHAETHVFSHPSLPDTGVDLYWQDSDQKEWFVTCETCKHEQFLRWPESVDMERRCYQCLKCQAELSDQARRRGVWKGKKSKKGAKFSGYHISLLMSPRFSAGDVIDRFSDPKSTPEFFANKVLGLPYLGQGNKLTREQIMANLTDQLITPLREDRCVMGVDTGLKLDYVMGSGKGLFFHGEAKDYDELDAHMERWPKMVCMMDAGGDLIGSRKFRERWKGRVWLVQLGGERKGTDESAWNDDEGMVSVDRNKMIQLVVDEFGEKRIPLQGTEDDWHEYALDWKNLHRIRTTNPVTGQFSGFKWVRTARDHRALATVMFRTGLSRFSGGIGAIIRGTNAKSITPSDPSSIVRKRDWRD